MMEPEAAPPSFCVTGPPVPAAHARATRNRVSHDAKRPGDPAPEISWWRSLWIVRAPLALAFGSYSFIGGLFGSGLASASASPAALVDGEP